MPDEDARGTGNREVYARSIGVAPEHARWLPPPIFDPLYPMSTYKEGIDAVDDIQSEPEEPEVTTELPVPRGYGEQGSEVIHLDVPDNLDDPRGTASRSIPDEPPPVPIVIPTAEPAPEPVMEDPTAWMYDLNRGLIAHGVRPLQDPSIAPTPFEVNDRARLGYHPVYDPKTGQIAKYSRVEGGVRIVRDRAGKVIEMSEIFLEPPDIDPETLVAPGKAVAGASGRLVVGVVRRGGAWAARATAHRLAPPTARSAARGLTVKQIAKYLVEGTRTGTREIDPANGVLPWIRHSWAGAVRKEVALDADGVPHVLQSAHIVPQDVGKLIPGYKGRNALTVLLPPKAHAAFDSRWKAIWQAKKASGDPIYVRDVRQMVDDAIQGIPDSALPAAAREVMRQRLRFELHGGPAFNGLGLKPSVRLK